MQVSRKGEAKRFKPFRALGNRQLLWHGSRTTNYAGILAQVRNTITCQPMRMMHRVLGEGYRNRQRYVCLRPGRWESYLWECNCKVWETVDKVYPVYNVMYGTWQSNSFPEGYPTKPAAPENGKNNTVLHLLFCKLFSCFFLDTTLISYYFLKSFQ